MKGRRQDKKTYISLAPCHIMVGSSVAHKILDEFMKENIFSLNTGAHLIYATVDSGFKNLVAEIHTTLFNN